MLKINKILSKKIKFPLSLRGAKKQSNLNPKGFSLIELMIALGILALAVFGIFNAYSVGFMGMADARDRTVATNYAREAMEDIKNMDFLEIENTNFTTEEIDINGKIFTKAVHIDKIDNNLKKVTSWVSWYNRNNKRLEVKNKMLIQNSAITSDTGIAVKIVLYAAPYYNVLPGSETTNLTAVVKDQNGNILTKWDNTEDVSFSIISSTDLDGVTVGDLGSISPTVVTLNQGSASTTFTSGNENLLGYVTIQALVVLPDEGQLTDTVTLKITDTGVAINLVANPQTIFTNGSTSNIIATIVDASTPPNKVDLAENLITFSISDPSLGSLEGPNPVKAVNGEANIILKSTELPGTVTITAFATDLQTGTVEITTSEEIVPTSISISADPISIYNGKTSDITVTIKDQYGNPVGGFEGTVTLLLSPDNYGYVDAPSLGFTEESFETTVFHASSSGKVTVTASGNLGGDVSVVNDSVTINIYDYPTDIILTALPESIKADGNSYSQIKATLENSEGKVPIAGNLITFSIIDLSLGSLEGPNQVNAVNGEAWIALKSTELPGIVTITASATDLQTGTVEVLTTGDPVSMSISANPGTINFYDKSTITVTIIDENNHPVGFGDTENPETINLSLDPIDNGTIASSLVFTGQSSKSTDYQPDNKGVVTITASGGGLIGTPNTTIIILEPSLGFVEDSIEYNENDDYFNFNINVDVGTIKVTQMQISWDPDNSENLTKIIINEIEVFIGEVISNSPPISIIDYSLVDDVHHISFYFDTKMRFMKNKNFAVNFYTSSGYYYSITFSGPSDPI